MTMTETRPRPRPRRETVASRLYSTQEVIEQTGISFRVLDYWLRTSVVVLSEQDNQPGSGNRRHFTANEVEAIGRLVQRYRAANAELEAIRTGKAWAEVAA